MSDEQMKNIARESIRSFNEADWNAARKIHAENILYVEKPTGQTIEGYEAFGRRPLFYSAVWPARLGEIEKTSPINI